RAAARALRDAGGEERRGREGRIGERACLRTGGAQVLVYPQRRIRLDARAQGRDRPCGSSGDGVQSERLRRAAVGRGGQERRGIDVQAACLGGATCEDDRLPHLVPRAAPSTARLVRASNPISTNWIVIAGFDPAIHPLVRNIANEPPAAAGTDRLGKRYSALTPAARITVAHFSV